MDLDYFLTEYVEGFLFKDLEKMAEIRLGAGETKGSAAYPMVASALAGMELLGMLLYQREYCPGHGDSHFRNYSRHFLTRAHPKYGSKAEVADMVRDLIRNGLAHVFLPKPGITITKDRCPSRHFVVDVEHQVFVIDALCLCDDLISSYRETVRPIVAGVPYRVGNLDFCKKGMQNRLNELVDDATRRAKRRMGAVPASSLETIQYLGSYSGSMGLVSPETIFIDRLETPRER